MFIRWLLPLVIFVIISSTNSYGETSEYSNPAIIEVVKDELQKLRLELTKSFVGDHSQRKREILKHTYEVSLNTSSPNYFESKTESIGYSTTIYKDHSYVFQANGIYRLEGLLEKRKPNLVQVTSWKLDRGERVLSTYEWDGKLFILTSNQNGSYSKIYTVQGPDFELIFKQQIRNQGYAIDAHFFVHSADLYLVITNDNLAHSTTISPVYRWSRTYMDQIHEIQTRGASAVEVFSISIFTYIAIAQAEDENGNHEVGTLIVRMFSKGELEKVQLLWSYEPVSLKYLKVFKENFLIIGQNQESSIAYWFGGYDFVYWQSLDGLQGKTLYLDSLILPDGDPLLLASTETQVSLYTPAKNPQVHQTSILNRTSVLYTTSTSSNKITEARFMLKSESEVYLVLSIQTNSGSILKVNPVSYSKIPIPESQYKDSEDKLSSCMESLAAALDKDEPFLEVFVAESPSILTKDADWDYKGSLVTDSTIIFNGESTSIRYGNVKPELYSLEDKYELTPSVTLGLAEKFLSTFEYGIQDKLNKVLHKNEAGNITGNLSFSKKLTIQNLEMSSNLRLETINDVVWSSLENDVLLRRAYGRDQTVTGNWEIDTLKANSVQAGNQINDVSINDFLLTSCDQSGYRKQNVYGKFIFNKDTTFEKGILIGPSDKINEIEFGSIALLSDKRLEIRGFKQSDYVNGGKDLNINYINGIKLGDWYASVLKTTGEEEYSSGEKTFTGEFVIDSLEVETLNGENWNDFIESVLLNGRNQTIYGDLSCRKLKVTQLNTETINNQQITDWMTTSTDQSIKSKIYVGELKIRKNLYTEGINNIQISDAILKSETNVIINGPIEFTKLTVGNNINLGNYVKINNIDISEVAGLRKKHTYYYSDDYTKSIVLEGNVQSGSLLSEYFNGQPFLSIRDFFWRSDVNNEITEDFNFKNTKVEIEGEFRTGKLNGLNTDSDIVTTTKNNEIISTNIEFKGDVVVQGNVIMPNGVTLNEKDFSEIENSIIRMNENNKYRKIKGKKTFQDNVQLNYGIRVGSLNGINLEKDLLFLSSAYRTQVVTGPKKFQLVTAGEVDSEADIEVYGTVNGYKLQEIAEVTIYNDKEEIKIIGDVVFDGYLKVDELYVKNKINGLQFDEIVSGIISLDKPVQIDVPLIVYGGGLEFREDVTIETINNLNVKEYLSKVVNKYSDTYFTGTKKFTDIKIEGDLDCRTINNIDLKEIESKAFSKTKDQIITGSISFLELRSEGNLITERLSGIQVSDFIRTDQLTTINSDIIFSDEILAKNKIVLTGKLNGYQIEEVAYGLTTLKGNRKFESIIIEGNLNWEYSKENLKKLSYLINQAVTTDKDQNITGKIYFTEGLTAEYIKSNKWINDINLEALIVDSIFLDQPIVLTGSNSFQQALEINSALVRVTGNLNTPEINNIILKDLYREVVRGDYQKSIQGEKIFEYGISVEKLIVVGTIDGIYPKDLVTLTDKRTIDQVTLSYVTILENLDFRTLNGFQIREFLAQRISLAEDQRINGNIVIEGDVVVFDCNVETVNGLNTRDVFKYDAKYLQTITGQKTFSDVAIRGSLEDTSINGYRFETIASQILRRDEPEVIERHVIFKNQVTIRNDVEVTKDINSYYIDTVSEAYTQKLSDIISTVRVTKETKKSTTELILQLEATQESSAIWLNYIRLREKLYDYRKISRVEHFVDEDDKLVTIALHHPVDGTAGGLPAGCTCNSIKFLQLDQNYSLRKLSSVDCLNVFDVESSTGSSYTVYSQTVSYNSTCSKSESGSTYISYMYTEEDRYKIHRGETTAIAEFTLGKIDTGYISDVKAFSTNGKEYLVIAQYYNRRTGGHNTEVLVYETTGGVLRKVQGIISKAATRLSIKYIGTKWILVIANSYYEAEGQGSCDTNSAIYQWSSTESQFALLREVQTIGAVDTSIILVENHNGEAQQSFVAFAENEDGYGKLSLYQYDRAGKNYLLYQTFEYDGLVGGIYSFSLPQFSYLVVSMPSKGVLLYEYLYAEGFKLKSTIQIRGVSDINAIKWDQQIFFPIASSTSNSYLAEAVLEGLLNPNPLPKLTELQANLDAY